MKKKEMTAYLAYFDLPRLCKPLLKRVFVNDQPSTGCPAQQYVHRSTMDSKKVRGQRE